MTLQTAIELGKSCDLTDPGECVLNIEIHALSIFDYDKLAEELAELRAEYKAYLAKQGLKGDSHYES